jgi:hypothetical protein
LSSFSLNGLSYDQVAPRIYQGTAPPPGLYPFNVIVLAAASYQPDASSFPGSVVIRAPLNDVDNVFPPDQQAIAVKAAEQVVSAYRKGKTILVSCQKGWNRSGVVTALALRIMGATAEQAITTVRAARGPDAVSNPAFYDFVMNFKPTPERSPLGPLLGAVAFFMVTGGLWLLMSTRRI